ncbi:acyl-CoA dehydrogenase [Lederbergia sp. NSJ-179]|uniref:acyl-CoA dehydrogenase n=1 Tax=Lederbergia sp. NSJ-179 TaxID=2931402 RepID=UPI001FD38C56|nr:acyl-CoA dehydrogenase [Lederbergia sp. NSJ-179]MCJ7840967.1 acyl-CoA dehydrogenase [Lederbergia sp. NSJ-179]
MFGKALVDDISSQAMYIDYSGVIPDTLLQWLYEQKLFKLFVPEALGGKMLELPDALRVFQKVSEIEGNAGWLTAIGSGGGMFVPNIQKPLVEHLFKDEKAVIAGSGYPNGEVRKIDGGYIVSGEWKYCSGSSFASFYTANSTTENGEIISFIFMPNQVEIIEDWNALGLRGTGSHTIRVRNALVSEEYTFQLAVQQNEYAGPVHRFPFIPFSQASFTSVCLGIAMHFYKEARRIVKKRAKNEPKRWEAVTLLLDEQETNFQEKLEIFYTEIEALWKLHVNEETISEQNIDQFSKTCKETVQIVIQDVDCLIRYLGMDAIMETATVNKIWRDLHTAGQHAFITPR